MQPSRPKSEGNRDPNHTLYTAASNGDVEVISQAARKGGRVQWRNPASDGRTALHAAAREGHSDAIRTLVMLGADVRATNIFGETALHEASSAGKTPAIVQLVSLGADVNIANAVGNSPLHCAAASGHEPAAIALLRLGGHTDAHNGYKMTAADLAGLWGHAALQVCLLHASPSSASSSGGGEGGGREEGRKGEVCGCAHCAALVRKADRAAAREGEEEELAQQRRAISMPVIAPNRSIRFGEAGTGGQGVRAGGTGTGQRSTLVCEKCGTKAGAPYSIVGAGRPVLREGAKSHKERVKEELER